MSPDEAYDLMGASRSLMPVLNPRDAISEMNESKEFLSPHFD
tara:strand:+ start:876 stop:1001 length:126 start_codon:yes stop_codon:yes gene_type:complete